MHIVSDTYNIVQCYLEDNKFLDPSSDNLIKLYLRNQFHGAELIMRSWQLLGYSREFLMKPEDWLPLLQDPTSCLYPEPDKPDTQLPALVP
jgi:hypothetical protein